LLPILSSALLGEPVERTKVKRRTYRKVDLRNELERRLRNWRKVVRSDDPVFQSFPDHFLLTDDSIVVLAQAKPADLANEDDVVTLLEESDEWKNDFAAEVFSVIDEYNIELEEAAAEARRVKDAAKRAARLKAKRMKGRPNGEDSDDYEVESEDDEHVPDVEELIDSEQESDGDDIPDAANTFDHDDVSDGGVPFTFSYFTSDSPSPPTSPVTSPINSNHGSPRHLVRPRPTESLQENITMISPRPAKRVRIFAAGSIEDSTNTNSKDSLL
jgi:hypothetical protein